MCLDFDPRPALSVVKGLLGTQLERALVGERLLRSTGDPDAIHDLRVAQRRTRVLLKENAGLLPATASTLRSDLRWVARSTGPVRDLDMLIERLSARFARWHDHPLAPVLAQERGRGLHTLLDRLESPRHQAMIERWKALVDSGDSTIPASDRIAADRFASCTQSSLADRATRLFAGIDAVDTAPTDDAIHRVRITAKSVRYLLEFLQEVRPSADGAALVYRLKKLQDRLGAYQDLAVHVSMLQARPELEAAGHLAESLDRTRSRTRPVVVRAMVHFAGPRTRSQLDRITCH